VPLCYRLFRDEYSPADATGAYRAGGRWNEKGIAILYASTTLSLACLEILVHIKEPRLPVDYAWVSDETPVFVTTRAQVDETGLWFRRHVIRTQGEAKGYVGSSVRPATSLSGRRILG